MAQRLVRSDPPQIALSRTCHGYPNRLDVIPIGDTFWVHAAVLTDVVRAVAGVEDADLWPGTRAQRLRLAYSGSLGIGGVMIDVVSLSGPYAVGKDSVIAEVLRSFPDHTRRVSTWTTRSVDPEADPSYTHINPDEMAVLEEDPAEWVVTHQMGGRVAYATSLAEILTLNRHGFLAVHAIQASDEGIGALRRALGKRLRALALLPGGGSTNDQLAELERRLLGRGRDGPEQVRARLTHQTELLEYVNSDPTTLLGDGSRAAVFDITLTNDDLMTTTSLVLEEVGRALHANEGCVCPPVPSLPIGRSSCR